MSIGLVRLMPVTRELNRKSTSWPVALAAARAISMRRGSFSPKATASSSPAPVRATLDIRMSSKVEIVPAAARSRSSSASPARPAMASNAMVTPSTGAADRAILVISAVMATPEAAAATPTRWATSCQASPMSLPDAVIWPADFSVCAPACCTALS